MIKLIIHIALFSCLFAKLPNDVRWVRNSMEYKEICKGTFNSAYNKISKIIGQKTIKVNNFRTAMNRPFWMNTARGVADFR